MWRCIQRLNSAVYGVTPPETAAAVPSSKIVAPPPNQDSSLCEMETELRMRRRRRFVDAAAADHNQGCSGNFGFGGTLDGGTGPLFTCLNIPLRVDVRIEVKRLVTTAFPAKILQLSAMLKGEKLSLSRVSQVRDLAVNSIQQIFHEAAAEAHDEPAAKRQRMDEKVMATAVIVPTNRIPEVKTPSQLL